MSIRSKLPNSGTSVFAVMSGMAREYQAVNLSQGYPDFDSGSELFNLVEKYMRDGYNQYAPMPGVAALREQLAKKMMRLYKRQINMDSEITVTAGATQALFSAISAFVSAGDEVIIFEPAYDSYAPAVQLQGGIVRPYTLEAPDYRIDWQRVRDMINPRTRMLMINTPHNPTGTLLSAQDMLALQELLQDTGILLISDEVYEHLIFDGQRHESVLRYDGLWERSIATYSFGKTFHNTGWKMGYAVGPEPLMKELRKAHQFQVFSVNTPIQYALADYLQLPGVFDALPALYEPKRNFFAAQLADSRFTFTPAQGTYFQLASYADISDENDWDFAARLTREIGVAAIPVSAFYSNGHDDKMLRFCFAKSESTLEEAGKKLCAL